MQVIYDLVIHYSFYSGCYFVYPMCLLIVNQNEFPGFTVLCFLSPLLNKCVSVDFDITNCEKIHSIRVLLLDLE